MVELVVEIVKLGLRNSAELWGSVEWFRLLALRLWSFGDNGGRLRVAHRRFHWSAGWCNRLLGGLLRSHSHPLLLLDWSGSDRLLRLALLDLLLARDRRLQQPLLGRHSLGLLVGGNVGFIGTGGELVFGGTGREVS